MSPACLRVELNGTSLVNHANADIITSMIDRFVKTEVIKVSMIKILTYYEGQRSLLKQKIGQLGWNPAMKKALEISIVDSFQGRESGVVIVDTVVAKAGLVRTLNDDTVDDPEDLGTEDYVKMGEVTRHVRDANRLNVALTRDENATIVVCQAGLLSSVARPHRGKKNNALPNMIGNAMDRKCIVDDYTEDSHADSVAVRAKIGEQKFLDERAEQRQQFLGFISKSQNRWQTIKSLPAIPDAEPVRYYRTRKGHTTRPIGDAGLVKKADAYDEEQIRLAAEASKATEAARQENERALQLGVFQSLDPPQEGVISEDPSAMNVDREGEGQDDAEAAKDVGYLSGTEDENDEDEDKVAPEYEGMDAGMEEDNYAD